MYNLLKESQYWTRERIENYQLTELNKLLNYAYKNVPYYNKVFKEIMLKPDDVQNFNDLKKIPFLTKEIIRKNVDDLVSKKYPPKELKFVTTGG